MNTVHEHHSAEAFAQLAHYVFAFHDSTFECIAADVDITIHPADSALTLTVEIAPWRFAFAPGSGDIPEHWRTRVA
jgi:hypothetical protein